MANHAMNDEEGQLRRRARRRLIGAVTLVTVMVIALPMVLDGESKQSGQDVEITIPSPSSSGDFMPAATVPPKPASELPTPEMGKSESTPEVPEEAPIAQDSHPAPVVKSVEPAKVAPEPIVEARKDPVASSKNKDEKSAAAAPKSENVPYVIQLGAFASASNAKERQSKLTALKIKFYSETVKTLSGDKLRVRAGPYSSRQEAEGVQARLKAAGIEDGVVAEKK